MDPAPAPTIRKSRGDPGLDPSPPRPRPFLSQSPGLDPSPPCLSLSPRSALALVAPAPSSSRSPAPSPLPREIGPGRQSALPHVADAAVPRSALPRRRHKAEPPPQGHPRPVPPPHPCPICACHSLLLGRSTEEEKMSPPHARCLGLHRALCRRRAPNRGSTNCCSVEIDWAVQSGSKFLVGHLKK